MQKCFYVQMLGGFSATYNNKKIISGKKSYFKYIQLLQFVWYHGEKGVTKEQLASALYDREDISNLNNSLNNLLYQMRNQMKKAGLPKGEYISRAGSRYIVDPNFTVKVDACEFTRLLDAGKEQSDGFGYYQKAFQLYQGELLNTNSSELWVMAESLRLKELFYDCVRWLEAYYKKQMDYNALDQLYKKVIKLYPYDKWQINQIELLIEQKAYKKAYMVYNDMVRSYSEEMGLPPSPEMLKCYEHLSKNEVYVLSDLKSIERAMLETVQQDGSDGRAYYCSYWSFIDLCQVVSRSMERTGQSVYMMLCSMVDYEKKLIQGEQKVQERGKILQQIIHNCLRKGDVFTKYNSFQFLILLGKTDQEGCNTVYRRIRRRYKEEIGSHAELQYVVTSLADFQIPQFRKSGMR